MNTQSLNSRGSAATSTLIAAVVLIVVAIAVFTIVRPTGDTPPPSTPPSEWTAAQRKHADDVYFSVNEYIKTNKLKEAGVIIDKHVADYPLDPHGHYLMAKLLIADDRQENAYDYLAESLRLDPNQALAEFESGLIVYKKFPGDAIGHYARAMELDPTKPNYPLYLGQALLESRQFGLAQENLNKALALNSNLPQAYSLLAEIDARSDRLPNAIIQINKALDLLEVDAPYYPDYMLIKAKYLRDVEDYEAALRTIYALPPEHLQKEAVVNQLATTYAFLDQYDKAAVLWEKLFSDNKQNIRAAAEAGLAYVKAGDLTKAKTYLAIGQQLDKFNTQVQQLQYAIELATP